MNRTGLGSRAAVALMPFLLERHNRADGVVTGWRRRRGVAAAWRKLRPELDWRPDLARAVEEATATPNAVTRQALACALEEVFADDPALADLVQGDLEDEIALRTGRATRVRRVARAITVLAVAVSVVVYASWLPERAGWADDLPALGAGSGLYAVAPALAVVLAGLWFLYRRLGQFAWVINWVTLFAVTGVIVAMIRLTSVDEDVQFAKLIAIVVLTVVPGWLYFQFVALRGRTVWEDYLSNLFRLHADDYSNLPEPPRATKEHRLWKEAEGPADAGTPYRRKFEAAYGKIVTASYSDRAVGGRRRVDGFAPVVFLTFLNAFGWTAVMLPFYERGFTIVDLGGQLGTALAFGFIGAYWFNLQSIVRRYFQNDLRTNAYISGVVRIIAVLLLVTVVSQVSPVSDGSLYALAFAVGVFPRLALQVLEKAISRIVGRLTELRNQFPLTHLDGLNMWYEARLVEEGIEDMQNLATADMVEMLLSTRVPVGRLVDWIDQALLYVRVKDSKQREDLRRLGIRGATDLLDAFPATLSGDSRAASWPDRAAQVRDVLYPGNADAVAAVDLLLASFDGEVNLRPVRNWRAFDEPGGIVAPATAAAVSQDRGTVKSPA